MENLLFLGVPILKRITVLRVICICVELPAFLFIRYDVFVCLFIFTQNCAILLCSLAALTMCIIMYIYIS